MTAADARAFALPSAQTRPLAPAGRAAAEELGAGGAGQKRAKTALLGEEGSRGSPPSSREAEGAEAAEGSEGVLGDDELSEDPWDAALRDGPADAAEADSELDPFPPNGGRGPMAAPCPADAEADSGTQVGALTAGSDGHDADRGAARRGEPAGAGAMAGAAVPLAVGGGGGQGGAGEAMELRGQVCGNLGLCLLKLGQARSALDVTSKAVVRRSQGVGGGG